MLLLFLVGAISLAIYNPAVQTAIAKNYLNSLAEKLNTNISVGSVDVEFLNDVVIHELYVEDEHEDTLLYLSSLRVSIDEFSFKQKRVYLGKTTLSNVYFNLQKYASDTTNSLHFIVDYFTPKDIDSTKSEWDFRLKEVVINNGRFNYDNAHFKKDSIGIDFDHIAITELNTALNEIEFIPQGVNCDINEMSFVEQSGFQVDTMSTFFNISPKGIMSEHLKLKTPNSKINGNVLFLSEDYADLSSFIEDVAIKSYFDKSLVSFTDISYFAPSLNGLNKSLTFKGEVKGSIANLKGRDLSIVFDDGTKFKGKANISGLPNADELFMHITVKELITSKKKLEKLPSYPFSEQKFIKLPANFNHLGVIRFKGDFTGFYHDFVAYGRFTTEIGSLTTDVAVKVKEDKITYDGKLKTNHFDLGRFFEMKDILGDVTMDVKIKGEGFSKDDLLANLDGNISQIVIKDYEYNNVEVKGEFKDQVFNGFVAVEDENVSFDFDGKVDLSQELPRFDFTSNIINAKLAKLNFIDSKQKLKTRFSTQLKVDLEGDNIDNLVGSIKILNSKYYDKLDSIVVDSSLITLVRDDNLQKISVSSDVLDFDVEGNYRFSELVEVAQDFFVKFIPSFKQDNHQFSYSENEFKFNLELHNSEIISKLVLDGAKFSPHTSFVGSYSSKDHVLLLDGDIPTSEAFGLHFNEGLLRVETIDRSIFVNFDVSRISQSDSIYTDNFNFNTRIGNDSLLGYVRWNNKNDSLISKADIGFSTFFKGYDYSITKVLNSELYIADSLWIFNDDNFIELDSNTLTIKNLKFSSKNQKALIDGVYSSSENDKLDIALKDFNLEILKKILPEESIRLKGVIDGVASVGKKDSSFIFTSDLTLNKVKINEYLVGDGELKSTWNSFNSSLELDGKFYRDQIPTILLGGIYFPSKKENSLDMNFELNKTELSLFQSFVADYVTELKGVANAKVAIKGTLEKPELTGFVEFPQETSFHINYLNTSYTTNRFAVNITKDMISFDNVELYDEFKNRGFANGTVYHEWFKDLSIDIGLSVDNFLAMNTTEKDNSTYYGKAYVTGMMSVGSYKNFMNIDVDVRTEDGTVLNIPLDDAEEIEENNFIEFVTKDTVIVEVEEDVDLSHVNMNFNFEITPVAEVRLIFDEQIGDVMKSKGTGNIKLNVNPEGDLAMFGEYVIADGDYLFTLQNVINKRFDLESGGTIVWNGSPYDATIDITAVYRLRARLYDLLAGFGDTTDIYKKRIPVDLKLNMKNNMMNPDIGFDIVLPTADEETKTKVNSVLYINSESDEGIQELNKQVFSLLVLNQFVPPPGSETIAGSANVGATTSSELLSNQLSNWLSKMSNDFDIGVNYRPGDEISSQEIEVALSTQVFNDRLIIDSNFGVSDNSASASTQNSSNIIGDITIEYKLTADGKIRIKAFNTSNQYSLENPNSDYTQGVGLSYREDFDTWDEFFDKLFGRFNKGDKKNK